LDYEQVIRELKSRANPKNVEGMARFGINPKNTLGVCTPELIAISKKIGTNHALAQKLWDSGIHEARIIAAVIADPEKTTESQMESWVSDFDSWDVCDQCCSNLFDKTPHARRKILEWSRRDEEFVKRAAFALMAALAVHDKQADDGVFLRFLPIIRRSADDERNYVKKAVNWALRQIGKRNRNLCAAAIGTALEIKQLDTPAARWIASDALRELKGKKWRSR